MLLIIRILFALLLLLFLSPVFLFVSVLIFLEDGFPVLFRQKRIGKGNKIFQIYKFRTMKNETPDVATHLLKDSKSYYTKIGPFLRKYSIDELPQLINIIKNDLAFIGPRPALYNQKELKNLRIEKGIHHIRPGITGWAQVNGRDNLSITEKVELDYYYYRRRSFVLNIKILWLTIIKVFKASDISV